MAQTTSTDEGELMSPHVMSQPAILLHQTSTKSSFPFLKLPAEIRNMIYSLLLGNEIIYIVGSQTQSPKHETGSLAKHASKGMDDSRYVIKHGSKITDYRIHQLPRVDGDGPLSISISFVCSQVYKECRLLPYQNTFHIHHTALLQFLLARTPEQLRLMTSVELTVYLSNRPAWIDIDGGSIGQAATMLKSLEYSKLNLLFHPFHFKMFKPHMNVFGISALTNLLGAWEGCDLKQGRVTLKLTKTFDGWQRDNGRLEEQLNARLMARSA